MEGHQNVAANDVNVHGCAACKHQKKRCNSDVCPLAPYFPASKSDEFRNVHRIFGVSNLTRILQAVPEHLRHKTAETLILEATMRKEFPVSGSLAVQAQTQVLIHEYEKELELVRQQICFFKKMQTVIPATFNHLIKSRMSLATVQSTGDADLVISDAIAGEINGESNEEDGGEDKCLDMQQLHELIDSYKTFVNFRVLGEPCSMPVSPSSDVVDVNRSKARGKQPIVCDESEEVEEGKITP